MTMSKNLDTVKISLHHAEQLAEIKANPVVKATIMSVVTSIPIIGDLIDGTIDTLLTQFQQKKRDELLSVILSDAHNITSEMVNDVEFIMNFAKTLEAVNRLSSNDKVKYFGNLLRNGYFCEDRIIDDKFDEYLDILNRLSYREIRCLIFLNQYEKEHQGGYGSYFENIDKDYSQKNNEQADLFSTYSKLTSTGLVEPLYKTPKVSIERHTVISEYDEEFTAVADEIVIECFALTPFFYDMFKLIVGAVDE